MMKTRALGALSVGLALAATGACSSSGHSAASRGSESSSGHIAAIGGAPSQQPVSVPTGPLSLQGVRQVALTAADLGAGWSMDASADSSRPSAPPNYGILHDATASCRDAVLSINGNPTTGNVSAEDYIYRDFVDKATNAGVTEWIGSYSGAGANEAVATLGSDFGACKEFELNQTGGSLLSVKASALVPQTPLGTGSAGDVMRYPSVAGAPATDVVNAIGRYGETVVGVCVTIPQTSSHASDQHALTTAITAAEKALR